MGSATCDDQVPAPIDRETFERDIAEIQKSMGMDQKCERESSVRTKEWFERNQVQGSMSLGFLGPSMNVGVDSTNAGNELNATSSDSGCGTAILDSVRILNSTRNINCIMQNTTTETTVSASAGASISIRIIEGETEARLERIAAQQISAAEKMFMMGRKAEGEVFLNKSMAATKAMSKRGTINIRGSTLRASVQTDIKILSVTELTSNQDFQTNLEDMIKSKATAEVTHNVGQVPSAENVRKVIDREYENEQENILASVTNTLNKMVVDSSNTSNIVIEAPNEINLENTVVDANVHLNIQLEAITAMTTDFANSIATKVRVDNLSMTKQEREEQGLPDMSLDHLKDTIAAGGTFADALGALQTTGIGGAIQALGGTGQMFVVLAVIGAVGAVLTAVLGGGGSSGGGGLGGGLSGGLDGGFADRTYSEWWVVLALLIRIRVLLSVFKILSRIWNVGGAIFRFDFGTVKEKLWTTKVFTDVLWFVIYCVLYALASRGAPGLVPAQLFRTPMPLIGDGPRLPDFSRLFPSQPDTAVPLAQVVAVDPLPIVDAEPVSPPIVDATPVSPPIVNATPVSPPM